MGVGDLLLLYTDGMSELRYEGRMLDIEGLQEWLGDCPADSPQEIVSALYERAREWFSRNARSGWTSCPITQSGCVRIMSHPGYPNALPVRPVMERLREATQSHYHDFWADDVSLLDPRIPMRVVSTGPAT